MEKRIFIFRVARTLSNYALRSGLLKKTNSDKRLSSLDVNFRENNPNPLTSGRQFLS